MPAAVVGLVEAGIIARTVRSSLVEVLNEDYIRTARSKGLPDRLIVVRHGLRNAFIPTITIIGINLGAVLGGVVIIETVFAREGIGRLLIDSVLVTDIPVVQGIVLFSESGELKLKEKEKTVQNPFNLKLQPGNLISVHWENAIEQISEDAAKCLQKYTGKSLQAIRHKSQ